MKNFLIFILTIFVLMVGVVSLMLNSYDRAYENAHNHSSYSWTKETYPVEKYSNPIDEYNDNFELLFNLLVKKLFSPTLVEKNLKGHMKQLKICQRILLFRCRLSKIK